MKNLSFARNRRLSPILWLKKLSNFVKFSCASFFSSWLNRRLSVFYFHPFWKHWAIYKLAVLGYCRFPNESFSSGVLMDRWSCRASYVFHAKWRVNNSWMYDCSWIEWKFMKLNTMHKKLEKTLGSTINIFDGKWAPKP